VICLSSCAWRGSPDPLFFRLKYLEGERVLRAAASQLSTSSAYCCQCSWVTVDDDRDVEMPTTALPWICDGHPAVY
jgi:hypothetical protein